MRPRRIIVVRHGEAEGNVDQTVFERKADHLLCLTAEGIEHARGAGKTIREVVGEGRLRAYVSPYLRARQTLRELAISDLIDRVREEPRLREQEWGNLWDRGAIEEQRAARNEFGHFFFRFRHGESGADVYDRLSSFLESIHRDFARPDFPENALLVTHGMAMRLFFMRWFHWSVEYFESLENPGYCHMRMLELGPTGYELDRPFSQWKEASPEPAQLDR